MGVILYWEKMLIWVTAPHHVFPLKRVETSPYWALESHEKDEGSGEIAQWERVLALIPEALTLESSIPHIIPAPEELTPWSCFFTYLHTCLIQKQICTHTIIK